jgi:hypothetical protein
MSHNKDQAPPREHQPATPFYEATWLKQHQHKGKQFQSSGSRPDERRDLQDPDSGHPVAGNQPEAIDNPAGAARPVYDQYELKSPQNMHHDAADDAARRQQAPQADGDSANEGDGRTARNADGSKASGYRSDHDEEPDAAPDATAKDVTDQKDGVDEEPDNSKSERGYG